MKDLILTAVGDVFLGDSPHLIGHGAGTCLHKHGWERAAAQIRTMLGDADFHFVNLETVVSHLGRNWLSLASVEMRGRPYGADFCRQSGWNVANIANNHIFQHGQRAYADTVSRLTDQGLVVVGHQEDNRSQVCHVKSHENYLSFVGFSLRPEQYAVGITPPYANPADHETILRQVDELMPQAKGPVVVSLHWGHEFMDEPSLEQQSLARALCGLGVKVVIGHHPHVVQGVEKIGDSLVAYSLGNFIFDLLDEGSRNSVVLRVKLNKDGTTDYEMQPILVGEDCLPCEPEETKSVELSEKYSRLSAKVQRGELASEVALEMKAQAYYASFSRRNYQHFFSNILRYNPLYSSQSIARGVLRRIGLTHDP